MFQHQRFFIKFTGAAPEAKLLSTTVGLFMTSSQSQSKYYFLNSD